MYNANRMTGGSTGFQAVAEACMGGMGVRSKPMVEAPRAPRVRVPWASFALPMDDLTGMHSSSMGALRPPMPPTCDDPCSLEMTRMNGLYSVGLLISVALFVYLLVALMRPEKF